MILQCFRFSVVSDPINTSQELNKDLDKVGSWANKWKMSFNLDPSKQAQAVIFFTENNQLYHPPLLFNNSTVQQTSTQNHLGIHLNEELISKHHINEKTDQVNK